MFYFTAIGNILWPLGKFCCNLVYFSPVWYVVPRKIWQPWSPTLRKKEIVYPVLVAENILLCTTYVHTEGDILRAELYLGTPKNILKIVLWPKPFPSNDNHSMHMKSLLKTRGFLSDPYMYIPT
jgi:hypothetical protein